MKTYLTASLFTLTSLTIGAVIAPGCTSTACEDLGKLCANCPSPAYRADCEETVSQGIESVCSGQKPTYELFCPELPGAGGGGASSSTSTSGGGTSANGTGGTGSGVGGATSSANGGSGGTTSSANGGSGGTTSSANGGAGGTGGS